MGYPPPPPGVTGYPPPGAFPPPPGFGYGYPPPPPPRPTTPPGFGNLFRKFWYVTTRPGAQTAAAELPTANWRDVWLGIILVAVVSAVLVFAEMEIFFSAFGSALNGNSAYATTVQTEFVATFTRMLPFFAFSSLISVPLGFFIGNGITFLIARLFGGTGTFLELSYAVLLYWVPVQVVAAVFALVPYLGGIVSLGIGIYAIVLEVFAVAVSQRMTTGKAVAVVLIPIAVVLLLSCALFVVILIMVSRSLQGM